MANPFDQFDDQPDQAPSSGNPFDQFDREPAPPRVLEPKTEPLQGGASFTDFVQNIPQVKEFNMAQDAGRLPEWGYNLALGVPSGFLQVTDALGGAQRNWNQGIENEMDVVTGGQFSQNPAQKFFKSMGLSPFGTPVLPNDLSKRYQQAINQGHSWANPSPDFKATYQAGEFLGPMALPAINAAKGAQTLGQAARAAFLPDAILGGTINAGQQYNDTGTINPAEVALVGAGSGVLGSGASGAGYLLSKLGKKAQAGFRQFLGGKVAAEPPSMTPPPPPAPPPAPAVVSPTPPAPPQARKDVFAEILSGGEASTPPPAAEALDYYGKHAAGQLAEAPEDYLAQERQRFARLFNDNGKARQSQFNARDSHPQYLTDDELQKTLDAWNEFFEMKKRGLKQRTPNGVRDYVDDLVAEKMRRESRKAKGYAPDWVTREAKLKRMSDYDLELELQHVQSEQELNAVMAEMERRHSKVVEKPSGLELQLQASIDAIQEAKSKPATAKGFFGQMQNFRFGTPGDGKGRAVVGRWGSELEKDLFALSGRSNKSGANKGYLSKQLGIPEDQIYGESLNYRKKVLEALKAGVDGDRIDIPGYVRSAPEPPAAAGRTAQRREQMGRDVVKEADYGDITPEMQDVIDKVAMRKAELDYAEAAFDEYKRTLWGRLVAAGKVSPDDAEIGIAGAILRKKDTQELPRKAEKALENLRSRLPGTTTPDERTGIRATLGAGVKGGTGEKLEVKPIEQPADFEAAFKKLREEHIRINQNASKKDLKGAPDETLGLAALYKKAKEQLKDVAGSEPFQQTVEVTTPLGQKVKAHVENYKYPEQITLTKEADELYKMIVDKTKQGLAAKNMLLPKTTYTSATQGKLKKVLASVGLGALMSTHEQAAEAADGSTPTEGRGLDVGSWARTIAEVGLAYYLMGAGAKKVTNLYKKDSHLAKLPAGVREKLEEGFRLSSLLFNDSAHYMQALDDALGTKVTSRFWMLQGALQQKTMGVKMPDPETFFGAAHALRTGKITPQEARNPENLLLGDLAKDTERGKAIEFFEKMTQPQRDALIDHHTGQKTALKMLTDHHKWVGEVIDAIKNGSDEALDKLGVDPKVRAQFGELDTRRLEMAHNELGTLIDSMKGSGRDNMKEILTGVTGNMMDYFFYFNPAFEITNFGDMFMLAAPKVGFGNIGKAIKLLAPGKHGDAELKALYENSNMAGGLSQIRREGRAAHENFAGQKQRETLLTKSKMNLIMSDKINADRVGLASLLQYGQTRAKLNGWGGSDVDFVKAVLRGDESVPAEMAVEAWAHQAEALSRTLGYDPLQANSDIFSKSPATKYLGVLMRQPGRYSNMMAHFLANGDHSAFLRAVGASAVLAGKGVIPKDAEVAWQNIDPEAYFNAAQLLEKFEVLSYVTGRTMEEKYQPSVIYPIAGAMNAGGEAAGKGLDLANIAGGLLSGSFRMESPKDRHKAYSALGAFLSVFKPDVAGVSTRMALDVVKSADESVSDAMPAYFFSSLDKQLAPSKYVSLSDLNLSRAAHTLAKPFIPGKEKPLQQLEGAMTQGPLLKKSMMARTLNRFLGVEPNPKPFYKPEDIPANGMSSGSALNSTLRMFGL